MQVRRGTEFESDPHHVPERAKSAIEINGREVIPCPRCDTDTGDLTLTDRAAHLEKCRGRWIQLADGRWGVVNAKALPDYRYCHACGNYHVGPKGASCRIFEQPREYA